uniref:Uncharacterized protein n=1 Tax=Lotharella globosa TaxID=91324 RepID=A0A7S4DMF2_9EUKA
MAGGGAASGGSPDLQAAAVTQTKMLGEWGRNLLLRDRTAEALRDKATGPSSSRSPSRSSAEQQQQQQQEQQQASGSPPAPPSSRKKKQQQQQAAESSQQQRRSKPKSRK